jgi:predicted Zn-dependent peptidase
MSRLGRAELVSGEFQDVDETLAQIRSVTVEQVRELAALLASAPRTVTVVGPFDESETFGLAL